MINLLKNLIIILCIFFCFGAAHLAVDFNQTNGTTIDVSKLFPGEITSVFNKKINSKYERVKAKGVLYGVMFLKQSGEERVSIDSRIFSDTIINLNDLENFEPGKYEIIIKPYYLFKDFGIKNVSQMSEYNYIDFIYSPIIQTVILKIKK